ncbi:hypothetical protein GCM10009557_02370 [Virgisporangium ochraceum]|uniref:Uncharacterized protein n=1 Tax=Virgisporangium ochraceum TaxID=65505 RepID=A0A8J4EFN7_9ACTN|nr:DUF6461 domain-containing protein [Virgisporangium ochraceum]GIJ72838.1 hypothetical protein Voc01_077550 [Virgisporangium ochraceum]
MVPTDVDYLWFEQRFPDLAEAYCVTLVGNETSAGLLDRFGVGGDRVDRVGVGELVDPSYAVWDAHQGDVQLIAATSVGQWALAVEVNGYLGVTEELFAGLSAGSRLVSHFRNVNAADRFCLVDDGQLVVDFEPLFAWHRSGSHPDLYAELMRTVGMRMGQDDDLGEPGAAAFALAEAITGVRLTAELFERSAFTCGLARLPRRTRR